MGDLIVDVQVVETDAPGPWRKHHGRAASARLMQQQPASLDLIEMPHRWRAMDGPTPALVRLRRHRLSLGDLALALAAGRKDGMSGALGPAAPGSTEP